MTQKGILFLFATIQAFLSMYVPFILFYYLFPFLKGNILKRARRKFFDILPKIYFYSKNISFRVPATSRQLTYLSASGIRRKFNNLRD